MEYLPTIVQEVNLNLKNAIVECLNPEKHYYVLFDQLDLGFSLSEKAYSLRLIGLLLAAKELNIAARDQNKKMTIGIFLRDDIYSHLRFEDKNKITENYVAPVYWDHGQSNRTLKGLMEKRFTVVSNSSEPVLWEDVFDEDHQMTGRQPKYNYMRDRTFLRPRDMIKFCNETHPPSLSRKMGQPPVLTSSNRFSTLQKRFACARLSQSCLPDSCSGFSATFTTVPFDPSTFRWLEINN